MGQVRAEGTGVEWKRDDRIKDEKENDKRPPIRIYRRRTVP